MSKKRILVVEDEESLLKLESILLTSKGYEVRGATATLQSTLTEIRACPTTSIWRMPYGCCDTTGLRAGPKATRVIGAEMTTSMR